LRFTEASGKTVEDALSAGIKELGCSLDEVTYEVLDRGSPGLFGMFGRLARVKVTLKEEEEDFSIEMPSLSIKPEKQPKKEKAPKSEKPAEAPAAKPAPKAEAKAEAKAEEKPAEQPEKTASEQPAKQPKPRRERAPRKEKKAEPKPETTENEAPAVEAEPVQPAREFPPLDVSALSDDGKKAYDFISNLTTLMGVDVEIRMLEEENQILVDITGDTLGVLIGRRGETLDAIQYLASLNVNRDRDEYTRVTIDVEHYRAKREETLRKLANRMANRARKSGRRVVLEPMNPYERRVLHSALHDNPYVETHSEGEEPYRRVIITLK